jgi:hypothetical protein
MGATPSGRVVEHYHPVSRIDLIHGIRLELGQFRILPEQIDQFWHGELIDRLGLQDFVKRCPAELLLSNLTVFLLFHEILPTTLNGSLYFDTPTFNGSL